MQNPFEHLGKPRPAKPEGELVEGLFDCTEKGCYEKAKEARYLREVSLLTWKALCGHVSKIEGFKLD